MKLTENEAIFAISLMAAFADDKKDETEREEIKRIADNLELSNSPLIYQNVLLKKLSLDNAVSVLDSEGMKQFAYEMAVCVCDADNVINESERTYLNELKGALGISGKEIEVLEKDADELAVIDPSEQVDESKLKVEDPALDKMILNYSILNGALELLPQNLATLAIIPLQTKMVYRIGKSYGYALDSGHIKEFIGAAGVGLTSQVVEGFARKFIGGFGKKLMGGIGKKVAGTATGALFSFASTYGLGKVAKSYYSSGRKLDMESIKSQFNRFKSEGTQLYQKYSGDIQTRASNLNINEVLSSIRGKKGIP
jgi:uncharacterized protein (DUF697 family)/uncharacterized tellurite resistance protein B-like protein